MTEQPSVDRLFADLRDADENVRAKAAERLVQFKDVQAREPLLTALSDPSHRVRYWAVLALEYIVDERVLQQLLVALQDTDLEVTYAAAIVLEKVGDYRLFEPLIVLLCHENPFVRLSASYLLSKLGGERNIDRITTQLRDQDDAVWQRALKAYRHRRARNFQLRRDKEQKEQGKRPHRLESRAIDVAEMMSDEGNNVYFTGYYSREAQVTTRYGLYFYAHLEDALVNVDQDVRKFARELGGTVPRPRTADQYVRLLHGTPITVVPECDNVAFNPTSLTKRWDEEETWVRFDFDFKPTSEQVGNILIGSIYVKIGAVEVAQMKFAIEVIEGVKPQPIIEAITSEIHNPLATAKLTAETVQMYQNIFVSYSRKDKPIIETYRLAQLALGNTVFIDTYSIRTGENWRAALAKAMDQADIFQLFWSENSASSPNVRDEWDYALKHKCPDTRCEGYIRPVVWATPFPRPPDELNHLHFKYVPLPILTSTESP